MFHGLNESPRPKAGKLWYPVRGVLLIGASMKVPALRRGNQARGAVAMTNPSASMKVPALRRGNGSFHRVGNVSEEPQ